MTLRAVLFAAVLGLLGASAATAQGPPGDDLEATPELREALQVYFVHLLEEELALSPKQADALRPRVEGLLAAHREVNEGRRAAGVALLRAARLDLQDPAGRESAVRAVDAALSEEAEGHARVAAARAAIVNVKELTPRQAARFLGFEHRFAQRVRQRVQERLGGAAEGSRGAGPGAPPGSGDPFGPEGGHPDGPPRGGFDGPPGGPGGGGAGSEDAGDRGLDEARKSALLVFTHELRLQLGLSDERTLALLPQVEELFALRLRGERQRRILHLRLLDAADDPGRDDAALKALVAEALKHDEDVPARLVAARRAIAASLTPQQAARFLVLEHRAERRLRSTARQVREGWQQERGEGGGPNRPGGGMRPRFRPEGDGPGPGGGGPRRPGPGGGFQRRP